MTRDHQHNPDPNEYDPSFLREATGMAVNQNHPAVRWWNRAFCPLWVFLLACLFIAAVFTLLLVFAPPLDPMPQRNDHRPSPCSGTANAAPIPLITPSDSTAK